MQPKNTAQKSVMRLRDVREESGFGATHVQEAAETKALDARQAGPHRPYVVTRKAFDDWVARGCPRRPERWSA